MSPPRVASGRIDGPPDSELCTEALSCDFEGVISKQVANPAAPRSRLPGAFSWTWVLFLLLAGAFVVWTDLARQDRVNYVSRLAGWSAPAGSLARQRSLIVPEHDNVSYERLDQTQDMFTQGVWRVRQANYENAPYGHAILATSPYRWWLALVAWVHHVASGHPASLSLEQAALTADPLVHLLLLVAATTLTARRFGCLPAVLLSLGLAAIFPLAGDFIPGAPEDQGMAQGCALLSVLTLAAGMTSLYSGAAAAKSRRWFCASGVIGAAGAWINVGLLVPVLAGIAFGGLIAAWASRRASGAAHSEMPPLAPWRTWALGGATALLAAFLVEYFPAHMAHWQLRVIHPLFGLAWLGLGEILARTAGRIQGVKPERGLRAVGAWVLSLAALAGIPVAMWQTKDLGFLTADLPTLRLARLTDAPAASNCLVWISRDGFNPTVWATLLPLLLVLPGLRLLVSREATPGGRAALAVTLGPVVVALGFACRQLNWWNGLDSVLLALLVTTTAAWAPERKPYLRWAWAAWVAIVLVPGALRLWPHEDATKKNGLTQREVQMMVERDLAQWMAVHSVPGEAVVLAPPDETISLYYYGGVRGVATLGWENRDGLRGAIRIVGATTADEAHELVARRGITHIVIPHWDGYMDVYARMGLGRLEGSFVNMLHHWVLPPWLRPIPYLMPTIRGFEDESVAIFQVVDPQEDATAAARLAEYFVEMNQIDRAEIAAQALRRFPTDLGALAAAAQVENARGDTEGFARTVGLLLPHLADETARSLAWDRRVSLVVVLALARHMELAQPQLQRCLSEIDEKNLRTLSVGSLYRFEVLCHAEGETIADPRIRALALDLLPQFLRSRLEP